MSPFPSRATCRNDRARTDPRLAHVGVHRTPRRYRPPASAGRGPLASVETDAARRGGVQTHPDARLAERRVHMRVARHPRVGHPAPNAMPCRPGQGRTLGPGDRARARLSGAVRVSATRHARVPVLFLAVGFARGQPRHRGLVRPGRHGPAVRRAPRAGAALRHGAAGCSVPPTSSCGCARRTRSTRSFAGSAGSQPVGPSLFFAALRANLARRSLASGLRWSASSPASFARASANATCASSSAISSSGSDGPGLLRPFLRFRQPNPHRLGLAVRLRFRFRAVQRRLEFGDPLQPHRRRPTPMRSPPRPVASLEEGKRLRRLA